MEAVLLEDMLAGEAIEKKIPRYYIGKYCVNNLYRYHHPEGYRSIYTLLYHRGIGICPTILEFLDHDAYGEWFGYR